MTIDESHIPTEEMLKLMNEGIETYKIALNQLYEDFNVLCESKETIEECNNCPLNGKCKRNLDDYLVEARGEE